MLSDPGRLLWQQCVKPVALGNGAEGSSCSSNHRQSFLQALMHSNSMHNDFDRLLGQHCSKLSVLGKEQSILGATAATGKDACTR